MLAMLVTYLVSLAIRAADSVATDSGTLCTMIFSLQLSLSLYLSITQIATDSVIGEA